MLNTTGSPQEGEMGMYLTAFEPDYKSREELYQGQEGKRAENKRIRTGCHL